MAGCCGRSGRDTPAQPRRGVGRGMGYSCLRASLRAVWTTHRAGVASSQEPQRHQGGYTPHPESEAEQHQQNVEGDDPDPANDGRSTSEQEKDAKHGLACHEQQTEKCGAGHEDLLPPVTDEREQTAIGEMTVGLGVGRDKTQMDAAHRQVEAADYGSSPMAMRAPGGRGRAGSRRRRVLHILHEHLCPPWLELLAWFQRESSAVQKAGTKVL